MAVADRHDLASLTASSRANGSALFFCPGERGVDEGFGQINLAAVSQVFGESLEQDLKASGSLPPLKATMAGLIRRIAARQIVPRSARGAVQGRPRPSGLRRGRKIGSRTAHCLPVRSMPPNAARRSCRWAR